MSFDSAALPPRFIVPLPEEVNTAAQAIQRRCGAESIAVLSLHFDPLLPGPRVTASLIQGAAGPIHVGTPAHNLGLTPDRLPGHRGMPWQPSDAIRAVALPQPPRLVYARSLVREDNLVGVVILGGCAQRPSSAALHQLADALHDYQTAARHRISQRWSLVLRPHGQRWLSQPGMRLPEPIRQVVDWFRTTSLTYQRVFLDMTEVELSEIVSADGEDAIVVQLTPLAPVPWTTFHALSPQQRAVAVLACELHGLAEVADVLGRGRETVKHHLKTVYDRLGIGTRAELRICIEAVWSGERL